MAGPMRWRSARTLKKIVTLTADAVTIKARDRDHACQSIVQASISLWYVSIIAHGIGHAACNSELRRDLWRNET